MPDKKVSYTAKIPINANKTLTSIDISNTDSGTTHAILGIYGVSNLIVFNLIQQKRAMQVMMETASLKVQWPRVAPTLLLRASLLTTLREVLPPLRDL